MSSSHFHNKSTNLNNPVFQYHNPNGKQQCKRSYQRYTGVQSLLRSRQLCAKYDGSVPDSYGKHLEARNGYFNELKKGTRSCIWNLFNDPCNFWINVHVFSSTWAFHNAHRRWSNVYKRRINLMFLSYVLEYISLIQEIGFVRIIYWISSSYQNDLLTYGKCRFGTQIQRLVDSKWKSIRYTDNIQGGNNNAMLLFLIFATQNLTGYF